MGAVVVAALDLSASDLPGPLYCPVAVPAGFPSPAQDYFQGRIDLNKHLIKDITSTFLVRVSGHSMNGAGISDGDELVFSSIVLMVIGLLRSTFFGYTAIPEFVEDARVGSIYLLAGSAASLAAALWSFRRGHPHWVTAFVAAPAILIGPSALKKNFYDKVSQFVEEEMLFFSKEVVEQFGRVLAVVGATTEVAYVYGGGAGPVKSYLYPALLAKATEMNSEDSFPTLYLDSSYSRHLNREGLYIAAEAVEGKGKAAPALANGGKRRARDTGSTTKELAEAAV